MAKMTESVELTQKDLEEAISDWLQKKFPKGPAHSNWTISLSYSKSTSGSGWAEVDHEHFGARASRSAGKE